MKRIFLQVFAWMLACHGLAQSDTASGFIFEDTTGQVHPWNHLRVNNPPGNFQFAIVTDRTGGHRTGVFEDAVRKLNLLQPEFVVCVGDLIEGYSQDENQILHQWDEFNGFIDKLEMPFFYVPGNHDYTNEVMARIWSEKFGPSYYHFLYKNVLLLCLNTEEAIKGSDMGGIEKKQFNYIQQVLEEHKDVSWTLVFMHQPLWLMDNTRYWKDVEMLLAERKHTVFVGHFHQYVKYERNHGNYFVLATTGGVSKLRGPNFGEFDHMVWVTMTEKGPVIANLLLEGIWDEDVVTEEIAEMFDAGRLIIEPVFVDDGFREGNFTFRIFNDANYPMSTLLRFGKSRFLSPEIVELRKTIPPNSVEMLDIPLRSQYSTNLRKIEPISLYAWYMFTLDDGREITANQQFSLGPVPKYQLHRTENDIRVDGNLGDWPGLPFRGGYKSHIDDVGEGYQGDFDACYDFNIQYDEQCLYLAVAVWDDHLELNRNKSIWSQDAVLVNLDPRPLLTSSNERTDNRYQNDYFHLLLSPSLERKQSPLINQEELLPAGTKVATHKSPEGFNLEIAVPLEYVQSLGGQMWETLRVNIAYSDHDGDKAISTIWWKPNWSSPDNYTGSGMFFKSPRIKD